MCLSRLLGLLLNEDFSRASPQGGSWVRLIWACLKITANKPTNQKEPRKNQTKLPEIPDTRRVRHCFRPCYFGLLFLQKATRCQPRGSGLLPPKHEEASQHEEHALRQDECLVRMVRPFQHSLLSKKAHFSVPQECPEKQKQGTTSLGWAENLCIMA